MHGWNGRRRHLSPSLVKLYGIKEIADALGVSRHLVAQWYRRSSNGLPGGMEMPDPDAVLSMGPIWFGKTIAPWIRKQRPLAQERARAKRGGRR